MGWCSGTDVFDPIVEHVLKSNLKKEDKKEMIRVLTDALEDHDWDCQFDSAYAENKLVKEVWKEMHPDWYEEGDE